jgi:hypothetical protein
LVIHSSSALETDFSNARLSACTVFDSDLSASTFANAILRDVVFEQCDLSDVDLSSTAQCERVDIIGCRGVDGGALLVAGLNVTEAGMESTCAAPRTTMGAKPRALSRPLDRTAATRIQVRYSSASSRTSAPLAYRIQTLLREIRARRLLGAGYKDAMRKARDSVGSHYADAFTGSLTRQAFRILIDRQSRLSASVALPMLAYRQLAAALSAQAPELEYARLPELVIVDGDAPAASFVDLGTETYIVLSVGLLAMTSRLARHTVAWLAPSTITFIDVPHKPHGPSATRRTLERSLGEVVDSGGYFTSAVRLQVGGFRDAQATALALTLLCFALAHELGHFVQAAQEIASEAPARAIETQADVFAAQLLSHLDGMDGDALVDSELDGVRTGEIKDEIKDLIHPALEAMLAAGAVSESEATEMRGMFDDVVLETSRFSECGWVPATVAAFIIAMSGSAGYHERRDAEGRVVAVLQDAFGPTEAAKVLAEMEAPDTALGMLRRVFERP